MIPMPIRQLDDIADPDWIKGRTWEFDTDGDAFAARLRWLYPYLTLAEAWAHFQTLNAAKACPPQVRARLDALSSSTEQRKAEALAKLAELRDRYNTKGTP